MRKSTQVPRRTTILCSAIRGDDTCGAGHRPLSRLSAQHVLAESRHGNSLCRVDSHLGLYRRPLQAAQLGDGREQFLAPLTQPPGCPLAVFTRVSGGDHRLTGADSLIARAVDAIRPSPPVAVTP